MKKILSILLIFSFLFPQEVCEGQCYTDEEAQNIELYITELEQKSSSDSLIVKNLNEQLQLYIQQTKLDSSIIEDYKKQIAIQEEMIKTIKPKWYENKYLWFFGGVVLTSGSVFLAGQVK